MIAKSNMKKSKSSIITLSLLIVIATILLYVGISINQSLGAFVDNKNKELNGAHFVTMVPDKYKEPATETIKSIDGFDYMEVNDGILFSSPKIINLDIEDKEKTLPTLFQKVDSTNEISTLKLIDEATEKSENSIILPYVMKVSDGYSVGDEIQIIIADIEYKFKVYAFYEDVIFGNPVNIMTYKCFVYEDAFNKLLENQDSGIKQNICNVIIKSGEDAEKFEAEYTKNIKEKITDPTFINSTMNFESFAMGTSIFMIIISIILVSFAFIIISIALIVINFTIVTHIERNINNIGSLEALGYTSRDMINSIIIEFLIVSIVGVGVGIITSLLITPLVTNVVSSSIGLAWYSNINLFAIGISIISIVTLVSIITYIAARKIKHITPLSALRNGIETHSFNHNFIPLSTSRFSLNISLGLKNLLRNTKQNIVIMLIVASLTFACVFSFITYYNMSLDKAAVFNIMGMETGELRYRPQSIIDEDIVNEISKMNEVKKVVSIDDMDMLLRKGDVESNVNTKICDNYSTLNIETIVDGRQPKFDNEIALTRKVMDELEVEIGDSVSINYNNVEVEFLVVGKTQQIYMGGRGASITDNGMRKLLPSYKIKSFRINLNDNVDIEQFRNALINKYKFTDDEITNHNKVLNETISSFSGTINLVCVTAFLITIIIVTLILFELIKVKLLRERHKLGILKAIGFITKELVFQVIVSFWPIVIVGTVIGASMGAIGSNFIMGGLMASSGIENVNFVVKFIFVVIPPVFIALVALATIWVVARRIRKISPYEFLIQ